MTQVPYAIRGLGLFGLVLAILVLTGWWAWKSKHAAKPTKTIIACLVVIFLCGVVWVGWKFQPWMPAGKAILLSNKRIGDYDLQVWQRKNTGLTEPFATGLFVRKQGHEWRAFLLGFEDTYRPSVNVQRDGSGIVIVRNNSKWGHFDEEREVLRSYANGAEVDGVVMDSNPPGNWWLRQSSMP